MHHPGFQAKWVCRILKLAYYTMLVLFIVSIVIMSVLFIVRRRYVIRNQERQRRLNRLQMRTISVPPTLHRITFDPKTVEEEKSMAVPIF